MRQSPEGDFFSNPVVRINPIETLSVLNLNRLNIILRFKKFSRFK